jgi:hypothetical protein
VVPLGDCWSHYDTGIWDQTPVEANWHCLSEWETGVLSRQKPGPFQSTLAVRTWEILVEVVSQMLVALMYLTLLEVSPERFVEQDH